MLSCDLRILGRVVSTGDRVTADTIDYSKSSPPKVSLIAAPDHAESSIDGEVFIFSAAVDNT